MKLRNPILAITLLLFLGACGGGPVKRVWPPTASVQELSLLADGSWRLLVRVQNYSNVPMTFDLVEASVEVGGKAIGKISKSLDLDVSPESADVFETTLAPGSAGALAGKDFAYQLNGRITSHDPKGDFPFEHSSRLSPVPGLPNTWR